MIDLNKFILNNSRSATTIIENEEYLYFGGTSYYELHKNEKVINSAIDSLKQYGISTASSRNSFGNHKLIVELEYESAKFFNTDDAVFLSSGFLSSSAFVYTFSNENLFDIIFIDELTHYASQFASKFSEKEIITFKHLDYNDLSEKLNLYSINKKPLIITDGVFPIFGNIAPIDKYYEIVNCLNGLIFIDDAHGIGVLGKNGRGTIEHFNLNSNQIYFGGTFSKAFGGYGGIIPIKKNTADQIRNNPILNGATPTPLPAVAASLTGLKLFQENPEMKEKLWENSKYLKCNISQIGIEVNDSPVPIVAWKMKSMKEMQQVQNELLDRKIIIQIANYIGSGVNGALRIVVFSTHTKEQIDYLIHTLKTIL